MCWGTEFQAESRLPTPPCIAGQGSALPEQATKSQGPQLGVMPTCALQARWG